MLDNFRKSLSQLIYKTNNTMTLPQEYLKYGNRGGIMTPDWTQIIMSDQDHYTGYFYSAIKKRANSVARIAINEVFTESKDQNRDLVHPYLEVLETSPTFSEYQFWHDISVYLDLEGVYYLMAIRNKSGDRYGDIQEFKMLNPYKIRRVLDPQTLEPVGYVESKNGYVREIPPEMIIEIRELNPFDETKPFAMTDAAKEAQFTLKTAGDYTRHSLKHNIHAPGIISTDVILPDPEFNNFKARVVNHTKGEPIFGNGKGSLTWESMNIDLTKASLKDVSDVNLTQLLATAGVSKTIMGIEQSGVTRDTSRTQKDLMAEFETLPRIQKIIDAFNQDYKQKYQSNFKSNKLTIAVGNPLAVDYDANGKNMDVKQKKIDLYDNLLSLGYKKEIASSYILGEIDIDQLGEPTNKPKPKSEPVSDIKTDEEDDQKQSIACKHKHDDNEVLNGLNEKDRGLITQQEGSLKNAIINIDRKIVAQSIERLKKKKNAISEDDLITKREKKDFFNELEMILAGFYTVIINFNGNRTIKKRMSELSMSGLFTLDKITKKYISDISSKVSKSHIDTIISDIYKEAQAKALEGASLDQIERAIKNKYSGLIESTRAKTIARTETNRAFTMSQYEADRQFIKQNKLYGKVFKQWQTRSDNPCPFCKELESRGEIPFDEPFQALGTTMEVDGKKLNVDFEPLIAGNAHPNCACNYILTIKTDNYLIKELDKLNKVKSEVEELNSQKEKRLDELKKIDNELKKIEEEL